VLLSIIALTTMVYAQQPPQGTSGGGAFWRQGGNIGGPGAPNIFGTATTNNNPIYTQTNGVNRMKINGSLPYVVNTYPGVRDGYLLLGYSGTFAAPLFNGATNGAYSQLHLNGFDGTFVQTGGYRPWMKTGITLTDNNDLSYFGLRSVALDVTETVINWSDNAGSGSGPDELTFRFTSGGGSTAIGALNIDTDVDGLHIARFTATGNFGLGNTFGVGNPIYVSPQSLGHYSLSNLRSVWQQFTNRDTGVGTGTAETANDGLRLGIIGNANALVNGTAALYNQENRHLLFSTNANTNTMNVLSGATQERMRITAVGTPTNLAAGGFGVNNPAGIAANITRVAVSHNPSQPVTRPMSLLHLGYNTGLASFVPGSTDGWRSWMDI
jgi:hypothetical protein